MPLRDIRQDLKDRLALIDERANAEKRDYESNVKLLHERMMDRMATLHEEKQTITTMLAAENKRLGVKEDASTDSPPTVPLDDFLVEKVRQHGTRSKTDLKTDAEASGYAAPGEAGRKVHFTLLNIVRGGRLIEVSPHTYSVPPRVGEFQLIERRL